MAKEIKKCRICGNQELVPILDLGKQALTGVFPRDKAEAITAGPLALVKCQETGQNDNCGLVQLQHSYDLEEMYGEKYGYRSGLNQSMVDHLHDKVKNIRKLVALAAGDLVIDIGSNDSTLLQAYPPSGLQLLGIDPTGKKFEKYYPSHIKLIPDFFSANLVRNKLGSQKAKVVTSISMLYDLEDPLDFMKQVHEILADDGIWVFEQSYMPTMIRMNSYDTICHEHLEYYRLKQIKWIAERVGFRILDISFNEVNGGSFSITVARTSSANKGNDGLIASILAEEERAGFGALIPYQDFKQRIIQHKSELRKFMTAQKKAGKLILGYGASTKGNVLLQYCDITAKDIPYIAEVNADKYGCFTPGTNIPIIPEQEAKAMRPDYFMVLPWHFKRHLIAKEKAWLERGGHLFFPLPELEVV